MTRVCRLQRKRADNDVYTTRSCERVIRCLNASRSVAANIREPIAPAAELLTEGGRWAASTWAVSAAAGLQILIIHRLFGDKQGLLEAVATHGSTTNLYRRTDLKRAADLGEDRRTEQDPYAGFGLANPDRRSLIGRDLHPGDYRPSRSPRRAHSPDRRGRPAAGRP